MAHISPYINFGGKALPALKFYQSVFGGELDVTLVKDSHLADTLPADKAELVFHSTLRAAGIELMASDVQELKHPLGQDTALAMGLTCDSETQIRDWFAQLSSGGSVSWPVAEAAWGAIYGECVDRYGIRWMLNFDKA